MELRDDMEFFMTSWGFKRGLEKTTLKPLEREKLFKHEKAHARRANLLGYLVLGYLIKTSKYYVEAFTYVMGNIKEEDRKKIVSIPKDEIIECEFNKNSSGEYKK